MNIFISNKVETSLKSKFKNLSFKRLFVLKNNCSFGSLTILKGHITNQTTSENKVHSKNVVLLLNRIECLKILQEYYLYNSLK